MKQFSFTLLLLIIQWANAQEGKEIAPDQIKAITYASKSSPSFYIQKDKNTFLEVKFKGKNKREVSSDKFSTYVPKFFCYSDDKPQTPSEILKEEQGIIYTKEIRETRPADFIGKSFRLKKSIYKASTLLKIVSPFLAVTHELLFEKKPKEDYSRKEYYSFFPLDLGGGKHIYMLLNKWGDEITIVPLKHKIVLLCDVPKGYSKLSSFLQKEPDYNTLFDDYTPENFMTHRRTKEGYELVDILNRKVLPNVYDTIYQTRSMLITQKGEEVILYQNDLRPKILKGSKVAHLLANRSDEFELLTDKGGVYYSNEGKPLKELPSFHYWLCGTISWEVYTLKKDSLEVTKPHFMLYELSGPAASSYVKKRFYLTDRAPEEKLSFINGNSGVDWNSNKDYVGDNYPHPEIVRVERNGKYGLFEYDIDFDMKSPYKEEDSDVSSSKKVHKYAYSYLIGKELLPIAYDHIQQQDNGLIYFYLNGKIGIYPQQKTATYSAIEPETRSFFRIIKDGKKGYLDIKTFKEYFF